MAGSLNGNVDLFHYLSDPEGGHSAGHWEALDGPQLQIQYRDVAAVRRRSQMDRHDLYQLVWTKVGPGQKEVQTISRFPLRILVLLYPALLYSYFCAFPLRKSNFTGVSSGTFLVPAPSKVWKGSPVFSDTKNIDVGTLQTLQCSDWSYDWCYWWLMRETTFPNLKSTIVKTPEQRWRIFLNLAK